MSKEIERRCAPAVEIRAQDDNGARKISGYAAVFNSLSEELWGFREEIAPGAFRDAIPVSDIRSLVNHDPNLLLGRTKAGTLTVREDDKGLYIENTLPDTQYARDLYENMRLGNLDQMSFGFIVADDEWQTRDGMPVRIVKRVKELFDVSPVTYPAYKGTSVDIAKRSLEAWQASQKTEEVTTGRERLKLKLAESE